MTVIEGQRIGGLVLLVASLAVYGVLIYNDRHPLPEPLPAWEDRGAGGIPVEVRSSRGVDGIYFLPERRAAAELSKIIGSDLLSEDTPFAGPRISAGAVISISEEGGLKIAELSVEKKIALGLPIDLNRATEKELIMVPGIGESTAARIIELRNSRGKFASLADLTEIPGIKEKKLRRLEKYLTLGPAP